METDQNTTVPPAVSASSAAESDSTQDKELQEEMEQWKQRMTTLSNSENLENKVT